MVISVNEITKIYNTKKKQVVANDKVSLQMNQGEVFGLFGHNGAGKTTLVNQMLGILKPTKGEIIIAGENITNNPERGRFLCSVQPQAQVPLGELTPRNVVRIMGKMRGASDSEVDKKTNELFERLDIMQWADMPGMKLSGGIQRLTGFCMAAINPGQVVILDEPTNDVDPVRRRFLWQEIRELTKNGTAVVLVTHNIRESESAVDRVAIMNKGKVLINGSKFEVKSAVKNYLRIELTLRNKESRVELPEWCILTRTTETQLILSFEKDRVQTAVEWAGEYINKGIFDDYLLSQTSLEDVYVDLINKEGGYKDELEE